MHCHTICVAVLSHFEKTENTPLPLVLAESSLTPGLPAVEWTKRRRVQERTKILQELVQVGRARIGLRRNRSCKARWIWSWQASRKREPPGILG